MSSIESSDVRDVSEQIVLGHYIDGKDVAGSGRSAAVFNPATGEISAEGWVFKYKGWIFKTNFADEYGPKYIFISNERGKAGLTNYPVAYFVNGKWRHAFAAKRDRPVFLPPETKAIQQRIGGHAGY